ncbi:MAG: hypothetical protein R6W76_07580, partial [Caldilinea sp.]
FGLSPMLGFDRYTVTAQAETEILLLTIEARPFLELLKANPVAESNIIGAVASSYYSRYLSTMGMLQGIVGQLTLHRQALATTPPVSRAGTPHLRKDGAPKGVSSTTSSISVSASI